MLDHEDLKWIATTSTELNSMLQQISRYADLARQHRGEYSYIDLLAERVELASKAAQAIFDRVTSKILEHSAGMAAPNKPLLKPEPVAPSTVPPAFTVMSPPLAPRSPKQKESTSKKAAQKVRPAAKSSGTTPASSSLGAIPDEIKVLNPKGTRELILLVDDEVEIVELASEMLTDEGYKVIIARDGFEALRIYQQISRRIGLIILDFFLPVMDGDAVFDEFRALNPNANVVLSSGFAEQGKLSSMLAQGLRGFIPKPYTREKLLEQVRATLEAPRNSLRPRLHRKDH
ncbi:MAG TPA: response regulator [Chthoniobacterales bacterium]|nr:response regulator [Chthoniobacterales bacterium]